VNGIIDNDVYHRAIARFRDANIVLPTFAELADPGTIAPATLDALKQIGPDEAHPLNLFRVHWYNDATRAGHTNVPEHVVLPTALTGVDAPIIVVFGDRFPMIGAHKVLAAYGCLAPRVVTGAFDPTAQRAVWPSTGNYCRGGVAISRIMGCRGVAVLPEGMSRERFAWLERWVEDPADIITTPGSESNVKEIYDACAELGADPGNVIFNQFAEWANHLVHYLCTGAALGTAFEATGLPRLAAFVSASGSAGTLGAGDRLREVYGCKIVAAEALECPTLLRNGFGEHNIQGIGDKHVPLIHNVGNTDIVTAVSDRATDQLSVVWDSAEGLAYLRNQRHVPDEVLATLPSFGLSSICNVIAAIKTAKQLELGAGEAIITVATDGAAMYASEREMIAARDFLDGVDQHTASETHTKWMLEADTDDLDELDANGRARVFNLGYYTWVEQQGVSTDDFVARRDQSFWVGLRNHLGVWDEMIREFNARVGAAR
jgi:cysteine synthase